MLTLVMALDCDELACGRQARAEVPEWRLPTAVEIDRFLLGCQSAGWETVPPGAKDLGAHYCPWHRPPAPHVHTRDCYDDAGPGGGPG